MSRRPIKIKQVKRMRKAMRATPPANLDLVHWLKDHGYADSTGQALAIIQAKRVKSESHTLGLVPVTTQKNGQWVTQDVVQRIVPAVHRPTLRVERA